MELGEQLLYPWRQLHAFQLTLYSQGLSRCITSQWRTTLDEQALSVMWRSIGAFFSRAMFIPPQDS